MIYNIHDNIWYIFHIFYIESIEYLPLYLQSIFVYNNSNILVLMLCYVDYCNLILYDMIPFTNDTSAIADCWLKLRKKRSHDPVVLLESTRIIESNLSNLESLESQVFRIYLNMFEKKRFMQSSDHNYFKENRYVAILE